MMMTITELIQQTEFLGGAASDTQLGTRECWRCVAWKHCWRPSCEAWPLLPFPAASPGGQDTVMKRIDCHYAKISLFVDNTRKQGKSTNKKLTILSCILY